MWKILSFIPKQVWWLLGGVLLGAVLMVSSYRTGVNHEKDRQSLIREHAIREQVSKGLKDAQDALDKAINTQKQKDKILNEQTYKLNASEKRSDELQELLDEVLSNPPTECDRLPESTYRLYTDMYNKRPSDRTN